MGRALQGDGKVTEALVLVAVAAISYVWGQHVGWVQCCRHWIRCGERGLPVDVDGKGYWLREEHLSDETVVMAMHAEAWRESR